MIYRILEKQTDYGVEFYPQLWFIVWLNLNIRGYLAIFQGYYDDNFYTCGSESLECAKNSIRMFENRRKNRSKIHKIKL